MKSKIVIYILCILFFGWIVRTHIRIANADINYIVDPATDTCNKLTISASEQPNATRLTGNIQNSCPVQVNGGKNQTNSYKLTIKVTSADGQPHTFAYTLNNQWCTAGYLEVNPQSGWCSCDSNNIQTITTAKTNATIVASRQPVAPYANCGAYQMDFSIQSVDGDTTCTYGSFNGTGDGLAGTAETGTTCAVPTTALVNAVVFVDNDDNGVFSTGDTYYQGATVAMSGQGNGTTNAQGTTTFTVKPGNYTLTLTIPAGYEMTTTNPVALTVTNTQTQQVNFGIRKIPTYTISGNVFVDTNADGTKNNGEANYTGGITIKGSSGTVTTNAANGTYTVSNLTAGTYTVSYTSLPAGYLMTYPTNTPPSFTITVGNACTTTGIKNASCNAGNIQNLDFGIHPLYTISGNVFVDPNKNGLIDAGETNYPANSTITATQGTVTTSATGSYTIANIAQGASVTVSYTSLPGGYSMTSPLNGPPPSYVVTVGNACTVNGAKGATCNGGNIANLNFGMSNLRPWYQSTCGDMRNDNGLTDYLPDYVPNGQFALISNPTCPSSPIAFTGSLDAFFGNGNASSSNQVVGGSSYPEVFSASSPLETAFSSLLAKAQAASITPVNLATVCPLAACSLPATLPHGIYLANGNLTLNAATLGTNANYIFLVNGNLTLNGNIAVPIGSTALFSTTNNITVGPAVGSAPNSTASSLAGWYIAGQNFIVTSAGNCNDLRLNVAGSVVVNALANGGTFQNNRDLCGNDPSDPTVSFSQRLDMILNAPQFLAKQLTISQEIAP